MTADVVRSLFVAQELPHGRSSSSTTRTAVQGCARCCAVDALDRLEWLTESWRQGARAPSCNPSLKATTDHTDLTHHTTTQAVERHWDLLLACMRELLSS